MNMTPEEQQAENERIAQEAADKRVERGDEVDPDADPELSAEDLAAVAGEGEPRSVPYSRFREVNQRAQDERDARLRAETEAEMLRRQVAPPAPPAEPEVDLKALRKARNDALLEGDTDKATEIDELIETERDRQLSNRIRRDTVAEMTTTQDRRELARTAAAVVKDYPFLNSASPDKNDDAIAEVLEWRDFYAAKGTMSLSDALERAVAKVAPAYAPAKPGEADDDLARRRQAIALSRGATTAARQPSPPTAGKGARASGDSPIKDVAGLTDDEYAKLPASEKRRLRGDAV